MSFYRHYPIHTDSYTVSHPTKMKLQPVLVDETKLPQPGDYIWLNTSDGDHRICVVVGFSRSTEPDAFVAHYFFTLATLSGVQFVMDEGSDFWRLARRATPLEVLAAVEKEAS